jgi:hypothetical protein
MHLREAIQDTVEAPESSIELPSLGLRLAIERQRCRIAVQDRDANITRMGGMGYRQRKT